MQIHRRLQCHTAHARANTSWAARRRVTENLPLEGLDIFRIFLLTKQHQVKAITDFSLECQQNNEHRGKPEYSKISAATVLSSQLVDIQGHLHSAALSLHQTKWYDYFAIYPPLPPPYNCSHSCDFLLSCFCFLSQKKNILLDLCEV